MSAPPQPTSPITVPPVSASPSAAAPGSTPGPALITGSAKPSGSGSGRPSNTNVDSDGIPFTMPAGAMTMVNPPANTVPLYKIAKGEYVTFSWYYDTNVIATPTALTAHAIGDNKFTYPVGPTDGVIRGNATQLTWDPWAWNQLHPTQRLAQATYTLTMWDERGENAPRRAGRMAPYGNLRFVMYTPQPYTPMESGWSCAGCNGASSWRHATHPAVVSATATLLIVLLSGLTILRGR